MQNQSELSSVNITEIGEYSKAVVLGVRDGIVSVIEDICHPVDRIILPISDFIHDATVIMAQHTPPNMLDSISNLQNLLERNPRIYDASAQRMQRRINELKETGNFFLNATAPQKVQALSSIATSIWLTGKIWDTTVTVIKDIQAFRTPLPPKFHTYGGVEHLTFKPIKESSLLDIRAIRGEDMLMYVVDQNRLLRITEQIYDHWHLGRGKPVYAAGDIYVKDGKIIRIDNRSGSYEPFGSSLRKIIEKTFVKNGFSEAPGKYVDFLAEIKHFLNKSDMVRSANQAPGITSRLNTISTAGLTVGLYLNLLRLNITSTPPSSHGQMESETSDLSSSPSILQSFMNRQLSEQIDLEIHNQLAIFLNALRLRVNNNSPQSRQTSVTAPTPPLSSNMPINISESPPITTCVRVQQQPPTLTQQISSSVGIASYLVQQQMQNESSQQMIPATNLLDNRDILGSHIVNQISAELRSYSEPRTLGSRQDRQDINFAQESRWAQHSQTLSDSIRTINSISKAYYAPNNHVPRDCYAQLPTSHYHTSESRKAYTPGFFSCLFSERPAPNQSESTIQYRSSNGGWEYRDCVGNPCSSWSDCNDGHDRCPKGPYR